MLFQNLQINNFLSIANAKITFPQTGLILISGWDDDLGRAIGAGKSSIFHAICWVLYNKMPRDVKVEEIIRRGTKSCIVSISFTVGTDKIVITRSRPSKVTLEVNGRISGIAAKDIQSEIERLIGLTYDQFLITSYFPQQGTSSRFVKQTDSSAKDFLGTILNLDRVEKGSDKVKKILAEKDKAVLTCKSELDSNTRTLERIKNISIDVPPLPDKSDVLRIKQQIADLDVKLSTPPDTSDIDADTTLWKRRRDAVNQVKVEIGVVNAKLQELDHKIPAVQNSKPHFQECPSCSTKLMATPSGSIKGFDESAHREHVDATVMSLKTEYEVLLTKLERLKLLSAKESEVERALQECADRRSQRLAESSSWIGEKGMAEFQLSSFSKDVKAHKAALIQKEKIDAQSRELLSIISDCQKALSIAQDELITWSAVKSVFSPTGFIAYSLEDVISDINAATASYLDILSQETIAYSLSSSTSDGKAKISHQLIMNNTEVSLGSLSGGEERGVILAVDFGIADVLVQRANTQLPSVLMLDECLEGLDTVGKERVLDALKEISHDRCILIIDHSTEFSALFDQVIKVTKKNEISTIEV